MLEDKNPTVPHNTGDIVYLRMRLHAFEGLPEYVTDEKGKTRVKKVHDVVWVYPVDKNGNRVSDHLYGVEGAWLIHPSKVIEDMKQAMEKKQ